MNKRQRLIYQRYCESPYVTLREVYGTYSYAKELAYEYCTKRFTQQNGKRFRIISHNSMMFTIGYTYEEDNKTYFHYESNKSMQHWEVK